MYYKNDLYMLKYRATTSPYYQIVRGNFRYLAAAMEKANELKQDETIQNIEVRKRNDRDIHKVYKWERSGFETIYLRSA